MNHQQTGKALPGRPHGFTDQVLTSLWCPFLQENQAGSVYIHGSIFFVTVAVSYASVAKINLNLLKKKEYKVQDNWGAILQQGLWQRLLRNTINKKENIHLAEEVLSWYNAGKHTQKAAFAAVSPQQRWRAVWRRPCCCLPPIPGVHKTRALDHCVLLPLASQVNNCHLLTGCLGFWVVHNCVNLKSCSPHTHVSGPFHEGIKKKSPNPPQYTVLNLHLDMLRESLALILWIVCMQIGQAQV